MNILIAGKINKTMIENVKSLAVLNSTESFPAYCRSVFAIPRLTQEQELNLANKWFNEKNIEAAQNLIMANLYLVAQSVKNHSGYKLDKYDLVQEGTVGLMKAVHKFDPNKGIRLATYAVHWIDAEIKEFILKNIRIISWGTSSLAKKLFFGYRKTMLTLSSLGQYRDVPTTSQIAEYLDVPLDSAERARAFFQGSDVSLSWSDHDENETFIDIKDEAPTPEESLDNLENSRNRLKLLEAIKDMPEKQRIIIESRFLKSPPDKLSDIALKLNMSSERVRQIEHSTIAKLKLLTK